MREEHRRRVLDVLEKRGVEFIDTDQVGGKRPGDSIDCH
jgi:hypothetical protein